MTVLECPECHAIFKPKQDQRYCSRHCARVAQARHGLPSYEDMRASLLSEFGNAIDKVFKPKDKP